MIKYYNTDEINQVLESYRQIFNRSDPLAWAKIASYFDFDRKRTWGCMTSNFHQITPEKFLILSELHKKSNIPDHPVECGKFLSALAVQAGCGYSMGINPYADKALLSTYEENTEKIVILIGHDWYPIDHRLGGRSSPLEKSSFLDRAQGPFLKYEKGLPAPEEFKRCRTGLLFINFVPDFRCPGASLEGEFPFPRQDLFDYESCLDGMINVIKCINPKLSVSHAVVWGSPAWRCLSRYVCDEGARQMSITNASKSGGVEGFNWHFDNIKLTIHPYRHPSRFSGQNLKTGYEKMWKRIIV